MKLQLTKHLTRGLLIAALAVGFTGSALAAAPADTDAQIHVSGTATRSVAPNYAILRLGITSEASTVGAAKTTNDRVMSDLIARLANVGITKITFKHPTSPFPLKTITALPVIVLPTLL